MRRSSVRALATVGALLLWPAAGAQATSYRPTPVETLPEPGGQMAPGERYLVKLPRVKGTHAWRCGLSPRLDGFLTRDGKRVSLPYRERPRREQPSSVEMSDAYLACVGEPVVTRIDGVAFEQRGQRSVAPLRGLTGSRHGWFSVELPAWLREGDVRVSLALSDGTLVYLGDHVLARRVERPPPPVLTRVTATVHPCASKGLWPDVGVDVEAAHVSPRAMPLLLWFSDERGVLEHGRLPDAILSPSTNGELRSGEELAYAISGARHRAIAGGRHETFLIGVAPLSPQPVPTSALGPREVLVMRVSPAPTPKASWPERPPQKRGTKIDFSGVPIACTGEPLVVGVAPPEPDARR